MTLNELFRRTGEPTYHTPIAVIGELVKAAGKREKWQVDLTISEREQARTEFNQSGGQVTIINPPFSMEKPKPKKWIKRWHAFGLFFAVSNTRLKKRDTRPYTGGWKTYHEDRNAVWEAQGHKCPICGTEFQSHKDMEAHHALPWARFPELRNKRENIVMLCHKCHKEIHCNPWRNIELMKAKAEELGIDLKERYDYDDGAGE